MAHKVITDKVTTKLVCTCGEWPSEVASDPEQELEDAAQHLREQEDQK